ncbi:MAG: hypothetical protein PHE27_03525 [Alphaproteobacteria bacterium]|nr:hypothetical protein [Alphaproteobacteria bacterium]
MSIASFFRSVRTALTEQKKDPDPILAIMPIPEHKISVPEIMKTAKEKTAAAYADPTGEAGHMLVSYCLKNMETVATDQSPLLAADLVKYALKFSDLAETEKIIGKSSPILAEMAREKFLRRWPNDYKEETAGEVNDLLGSFLFRAENDPDLKKKIVDTFVPILPDLVGEKGKHFLDDPERQLTDRASPLVCAMKTLIGSAYRVTSMSVKEDYVRTGPLFVADRDSMTVTTGEEIPEEKAYVVEGIREALRTLNDRDPEMAAYMMRQGIPNDLFGKTAGISDRMSPEEATKLFEGTLNGPGSTTKVQAPALTPGG